MPFKQRGARADHRAHVADLGRDHRAVRQTADAHGHVDVVLDDVDVAIGE